MLELLRYKDDSREVIMSSEQFIILNNSALNLRGHSLAELALQDSRATYQLFRKQLNAILKDGSLNSVDHNDVWLAEKHSDTQQEIAAIALSLFHELPDGDTLTFQFRVLVEPTEEDREMLGSLEPIEVLSFWVQPPNLAF